MQIHLTIETRNDLVIRVSFAEGSGYTLLGSPSEEFVESFSESLEKGSLPPLDWGQVSPFTKKVLEALLTIPRGEVRTYGEIASQIGHPKAARAVGRACGANPFPFFVPCHRVVGAHSLGGFSAGLPFKEILLGKEGVCL